MNNPEILISAGEPSGEMYAAQLAKALRRRAGARLFGLGGTEMRQAGVELLADASQVAVVGISEALRRLPAAWRILHTLVQESARRRPRLAILVNFPDFNLRLARRLHRQGVRIVYFISPQVWAWRTGRVQAIRRLVERMLVIFPFEEKFYRQFGVAVDYVGHPLVDSVRARLTRAEFAAHHGLDPSLPVVALLPGSRRTEVFQNLPTIIEACFRIHSEERLQFVLAAAPGLPPGTWDRIGPVTSHRVEGEKFRTFTTARAGPFPVVQVWVVEGSTYDALGAADCAIVSSGTATVEAALLGAPMVVVYRVSRATAFIARRLIQAPFFSMVNLILDRRAVPELIQDDFTPDQVACEVRRLLSSDEAREQMKRDLAEVRARLAAPRPGGAIDRAAEIIASLL